MKKRMLKHACFVLILVFILLLLNGCGKTYTESDIEDAKQRAYNEGYNHGYYRGTAEQWEEDCENLLIDGCSIRDIEERVNDEYGMTPAEAFTIVDEYEYESSHGGYAWAEYKNAIEVMYYTASIFPHDY